MHPNPFTLSLSSGIQVNPSENGYILGLSASTGEGLIAAGLTVPALPGLENAIAHLREGTATLQQLTQTLSAREGAAVGEQLAATLQALGDRGWLQYGVLPLAIAEPMADSATLDLDIPHWSQANVSLSRFAYQRSHGGGMVLESPLSKFRIKLTDWRASAILAQLAQPQPLRRLTPPPQIGPETAYQFLNLLWATGFLSVEAEAPELQLWEFHNLLFHSRSRQGRHDYPTADITASLDIWDQFPVVKPPMAGTIVPLPQFSIDAIRQRDKTLTTALEKRQSIREYDDHRPITLEQLGEFLYRTARVKEVYSLEAEQQALLKAEFGEAFDWGELSRRPYPCGGAMYELEIYPVVRRCDGVDPGLYHYDPLNHHLVQLDAAEADIQALLQDAHQSSGAQGVPQVLLIITARFGRLFRKYRSLAYALVLKHVGVLYENFYLVATAMDLAPCALGAGDSDCFAQATGLDYVVESSVGEFMLGSLPGAEAEVGGSRSHIHTSESSVIRPHTLTPPGVQQSSGANSSSPRVINHRYAITEPPLGERFTTSVYKAIDLDNQNIEVAIKIYDHPVLREDILLRKINSEREALTKLYHPHIIKMLDCGIDEATGYAFFALELMDSSLFDYLKEHECKNWQSFFATIALPILEALAFCHNQQYLHRDLCSVNVLINQDGQVKLTDFGESRRVGQDPPGFSGLSHDIKSRYFQPPETDNDTLPYARDVYTFGVLLIECLKGKSFFSDAELMSQQIGFSEVINTLPVPAEIQALIARTVAIDPAERPATAQVLLEQLQPLVQQLSPSPVSPSSPTLHPHDLDDRIPGLTDLRNHTLGDPRITIVILDGNPDHSLSCFAGAEISKVFPYWHPPAEPVPQEAYLKFQEIDNDDTLDKDQKAEAQKAAFPEDILGRIHGDNHACHITSTIVGQENTPSPGLAPRCRVINVPLNTTDNNEEFISPLNLARAFELALDLGANIIHCAACRPTQTGEGEELLLQALRKCLDQNILIVAPAGNNEGECWCMPATLPGVLSVGALKPDGKPYKFSNWGGNNALEGIMAPGGEILGAQPANEAPVRLKGTSMAAPVMTGLCGLLMSRQLQQGKPLDAEAIRAALLNTALPCTPDDTDEPERCLRGKVNLPGAMEILFGPSVTISFTGDQVTVTHHSVPTAAALTQTQVSHDLVTASKLDLSSVRLLNQNYNLEPIPVNTGGKSSGCSQMYRAFTIEHPRKPCLIKMPANLAGEMEHLCSQSIKSEKQALSCLHHPHIISMIDQGFDAVSNREFYVLEWLDQTLEQVLGRDGANGGSDGLSAKQYDSWETFYIKIGHPLLQAISTCHRQGFVHRDIQPNNVMFTASGQLKLIDFGLSRKVPSDSLDYLSLTEDHFPRRNHPFFAPEKDNNEFPFSQDVFGFALTALYCFDSNLTLPSLMKAVESDASFRDILEKIKIPNSIKELLQKCISFNPAERPSDAQILISELQKLHQESGLNFPGLSLIIQDVNPGHIQSGSRGHDFLNSADPSPSSITPSSITPATAHSGHVYALGTIAYDFGDETRRDLFRQSMAPVERDGMTLPPDPHDPRQMVAHLDRYPEQAQSLIWTLQTDGATLYALDPKGPFAAATYEIFLLMLNGQVAPEDSASFIDHVSLPGKRTERTVELLSGELVPVLKVLNLRGLYGWNVPTLVEAALATRNTTEVDPAALATALTAFLQRVYHDLRNVGQTSRDRALNFAVTNTFQAAATFAEVLAARRQLATITVEKSPYCRQNSDCWDVVLTFHDPDNGRRSRQVYRFTVDVADALPVTVGQIKRWAVPGQETEKV